MEPRRLAVGAPRELQPASAQDVDGWIENYWRHEARGLGLRVEELKRQLRRRTLVLGSSLALLTGVAAGTIVTILFSLPPFHQRPQLAAPSPAKQPVLAAPTAVGVTLPVPLVVAAQPAKRAGNPGSMVQPPPPPKQTLDRARRAELGQQILAPEHDLDEPVVLRTERRDAEPVPTAETRALPPSPSLRADDPADPAGTTSTLLRAVLSDIKRQMLAPPGASHPRATSGMPPRLELAEPLRPGDELPD